MIPTHSRYVVIGAGVHGLSTSWHLARELRARGLGGGEDICVLDKSRVGAGASGIACGTVRNNYFQPAMRELMAHSVSVWESDPEAFSYHPVGFLQIAPEAMSGDVAKIYAEQQAIGYPSVLVEGERDCNRYLTDMFADWQAPGITTVLHEKKGGYANNIRAVRGLATKAGAEGVRIETGVRVTGFGIAGGAVTSVETDQGTIACDQLVVAVGPWIRDLWAWLDLPETITVAQPGGTGGVDRPMWTYWALQEGTLGIEPSEFTDNTGGMPPVTHVDSDAPLYDDITGDLITDQLWGIYYKPDFNFAGLQGGASPYVVGKAAGEIAIDPYGPESPEFTVAEDFVRMWTSGLAHCHKRFEGKRPLYRHEPTGGIGAFTPDSFPVFDLFQQNAYVIADSNHGFKMIGVGALVARELLGEQQRLLEPFRFGRYATGDLHPVSNSPFPLELTVADNAGTIRMGMIGAGWIAQDHKRVLGSLPEAELVAVCDLDRERAEALASGTGARTYQDWRELLDREDLGAVIVAVPPQSHREPAVAALGRGLPVYLEKPIARTAEDAAEIVAVAKSTGTVCAVGYQWHALDLLDDLPPLLAGQQIGLLLGTSIGPTQSRPWFVDMRAGGGNLLERGSHHLDLARTVAGEVASVQTAAGRVRLARSGGEGGDIDDALTIMLGLASGALATIVVAWTKPGQPGRYGLDIVASDATLRLALDPDFTLTGVSAGQPVDRRAASQPLERSMSRFLRAVGERDPAAVVCTPPDAAATLAVAIAAERALETSRAVPVNAS